MEEAEREEEEGGEEEEEEEISKRVGAGGRRDGHGWWRIGFLRYWLWEEEGVRCEEEPIRGEVK